MATNPSKLSRFLTTGARYVLAGVFLLSGTLKLYAGPTANSLLSHIKWLSFLPDPFWFYCMIAVEFLIASLFLIMRVHIIAAALSCSMMLGAIVTGVHFIEDPIPCGCFGDILESRTDEFFLLRSMMLLTLSLIVLRSTSTLRRIA